MPAAVREKWLPAVLALIPARHDAPIERSPWAALERLRQAARYTSAASVVRWSSYFMEDEKTALYTPEFAAQCACAASADLVAAAFENAPARARLDRTLSADLEHYLPSTLLVKADRMTMAHSVEARSPFLDHELAEFAAALPPRYKVRGTVTKWILRKIFEAELPGGIARRGKQGFSVPLGLWFRGPLRAAARDMLLGPGARSAGMLNRPAVEALLRQHESGERDNGKKLWALLNLEMWLRRAPGGALRGSI